jgi:Domain of unknown function (DUF4430)
MRTFSILLSLFTFIFVSSVYAMNQSSTERLYESMESLRKLNVVHVASLEARNYILGATTTVPNVTEYMMTPLQKTTAFSLLTQTHTVVVEYTESGAVVHSINGIGMSESERASGKKWSYSLNGTPQDISPDRLVIQPGDRLVWKYQ